MPTSVWDNPPSIVARLLPWALLLCAAGCEGVIAEPAARPDEIGRFDRGSSSDARGEALRCTEPNPGPPVLRRLTKQQWVRSVQSVLGPVPEAAAAALPEDVFGGGYRNDASSNTIGSASTVAAYRHAAELVLAPVERTEDAEAIAGCDLGTDGCLEDAVRRIGRRLFRRPLSDEDVQRHVELATGVEGEDPQAQLALALSAMLQSPRFLYRVERGERSAAHRGLIALDGYTLATRLSYGLWGEPPDEPLLEAAENGLLDTPEGLREQAAAMLDDPRARVPVTEFATDWLRLYDVDQAERDPDAHPMWSESLQRDMREEVERKWVDLALGGGDILDLLTYRSTPVTEELAALYEVEPPADPWAEVALDGERRAGFLTSAAFLTATSNAQIAPIHRGLFIARALLCEEPAAPDVEIEDIPSVGPELSERQAYAQHREDPYCAGCHRVLDNIGFGFERYDAIGAYRTEDAEGRALSGEGIYDGFDEATFHGGVELGQRLREHEQVRECVTRHVFQFLFGRPVDPEADGCTLRAAKRVWRDTDGDYRELILALVHSDTFRYRRDPELEMADAENEGGR